MAAAARAEVMTGQFVNSSGCDVGWVHLGHRSCPVLKINQSLQEESTGCRAEVKRRAGIAEYGPNLDNDFSL